MRAINDDIDDDDEYLTLTFGTLPNLVIAGDTSTVRIDLVDNDDPRWRSSSSMPTTR